MVDAALTENYAAQGRQTNVRQLGRSDIRFRFFTRAAAFVVLAVFAGIMFALVVGAWPALKEFGFGFVTTQKWNPVTEKFGALAPIYGTLVTSFLAMVVAVPVGIGIAIFLTELCRARCAGPSASPSNCWPAFPPSSMASGACSYSRPRSRRRCSPG